MCRWLAYSGSPVLYGSKHWLIVQSPHPRLGNEETNRDGFGVGWCRAEEPPAGFRSIEPAWNDRDLREVSEPLGDLAGAWNAVPPCSWGVVRAGDAELHHFEPARPIGALR